MTQFEVRATVDESGARYETTGHIETVATYEEALEVVKASVIKGVRGEGCFTINGEYL